MVTRMSLRVCGVHGGFFQVLGVHFAQTLEALRRRSCPCRPGPFPATRRVRASSMAVDAFRPLRQAEEGRAGEVEVARVDHRAHLGEEEGHQQRGDMGAVDIGIGHDDDLVIAQIVDAEFGAQPDAKRLAQVRDLGVRCPVWRRPRPAR